MGTLRTEHFGAESTGAKRPFEILLMQDHVINPAHNQDDVLSPKAYNIKNEE